MRFPFTPKPISGLAALLVLLGCGGAKQSQDVTSTANAPVKAVALVYTAPTAGGYQLVKDASRRRSSSRRSAARRPWRRR